MRAPTNLHDLRVAHAVASPSDSQEVSTQSQGGGAKEPPRPPSAADHQPDEPEGPSRPTGHPAESKSPSPWAGYPESPSLGVQGPAALKTSNELNKQLNADRSDRSEDAAKLKQYEERSVLENDSPASEPPAVDDPDVPEPPSGQGISEDDFERLVGGQDRGEEQLPNAPSRPDYGDLKREQSQADSPGSRDASEPQSFSERHPSQGHEIDR